MLRSAAKLIVSVALFVQRRKKSAPLDSSTTGSILLIELSRFGDVVAMLNAAESFRIAFPHARLAVAVDSRYAELFALVPSVDIVYPFEQTNTIRGFRSARGALRSFQFDLVCSMSPSARNSLLALSILSVRAAGYFDIRDTVTPFLDYSEVETVGVSAASRESYRLESIYERGRKICKALGIPSENSVRVDVTRAIGLRHHQQIPSGSYAVVHPFAGWEFREWGMARFVSLARALREAEGLAVVFIGSAGELERLGKSMDGSSSSNLFELKDPLNISEIAALMKRAEIFIGNDSGPLHLASLLGVRTVGLFGPAPPALTGPQSQAEIHLYHQLECSPCRQVRCVRPEDPCMAKISVDEVVTAVRSARKKLLPEGSR